MSFLTGFSGQCGGCGSASQRPSTVGAGSVGRREADQTKRIQRIMGILFSELRSAILQAAISQNDTLLGSVVTDSSGKTVDELKVHDIAQVPVNKITDAQKEDGVIAIFVLDVSQNSASGGTVFPLHVLIRNQSKSSVEARMKDTGESFFDDQRLSFLKNCALFMRENPEITAQKHEPIDQKHKSMEQLLCSLTERHSHTVSPSESLSKRADVMKRDKEVGDAAAYPRTALLDNLDKLIHDKLDEIIRLKMLAALDTDELSFEVVGSDLGKDNPLRKTGGVLLHRPHLHETLKHREALFTIYKENASDLQAKVAGFYSALTDFQKNQLNLLILSDLDDRNMAVSMIMTELGIRIDGNTVEVDGYGLPRNLKLAQDSPLCTLGQQPPSGTSEAGQNQVNLTQANLQCILKAYLQGLCTKSSGTFPICLSKKAPPSVLDVRDALLSVQRNLSQNSAPDYEPLRLAVASKSIPLGSFIDKPGRFGHIVNTSSVFPFVLGSNPATDILFFAKVGRELRRIFVRRNDIQGKTGYQMMPSYGQVRAFIAGMDEGTILKNIVVENLEEIIRFKSILSGLKDHYRDSSAGNFHDDLWAELQSIITDKGLTGSITTRLSQANKDAFLAEIALDDDAAFTSQIMGLVKKELLDQNSLSDILVQALLRLADRQNVINHTPGEDKAFDYSTSGAKVLIQYFESIRNALVNAKREGKLVTIATQPATTERSSVESYEFSKYVAVYRPLPSPDMKTINRVLGNLPTDDSGNAVSLSLGDMVAMYRDGKDWQSPVMVEAEIKLLEGLIDKITDKCAGFEEHEKYLSELRKTVEELKQVISEKVGGNYLQSARTHLAWLLG